MYVWQEEVWRVGNAVGQQFRIREYLDTAAGALVPVAGCLLVPSYRCETQSNMSCGRHITICTHFSLYTPEQHRVTGRSVSGSGTMCEQFYPISRKIVLSQSHVCVSDHFCSASRNSTTMRRTRRVYFVCPTIHLQLARAWQKINVTVYIILNRIDSQTLQLVFVRKMCGTRARILFLFLHLDNKHPVLIFITFTYYFN